MYNFSIRLSVDLSLVGGNNKEINIGTKEKMEKRVFENTRSNLPEDGDQDKLRTFRMRYSFRCWMLDTLNQGLCTLTRKH